MHHFQVRLTMITSFEAFMANSAFEFRLDHSTLIVLMPIHRISSIISFITFGTMENAILRSFNFLIHIVVSGNDKMTFRNKKQMLHAKHKLQITTTSVSDVPPHHQVKR